MLCFSRQQNLSLPSRSIMCLSSNRQCISPLRPKSVTVALVCLESELTDLWCLEPLLGALQRLIMAVAYNPVCLLLNLM